MSYANASKKIIGLGIDDGNDSPASDFVDVELVASHFQRHLVAPSGGRVDAFIHTWVPSVQVHAKLLHAYRPVAARFDGAYGRVWLNGFNASHQRNPVASPVSFDGGSMSPLTLLSRSASLRRALEMVASAEESAGRTYDVVYVTRPDVLLWADVDLRLYCRHDRVYHSFCKAPFHPTKTCTSDLHFVLPGRLAPAFARGLAHAPLGYGNAALRTFVESLGATLETDHVVITRHEEVCMCATHSCLTTPRGLTSHPTARLSAHLHACADPSLL